MNGCPLHPSGAYGCSNCDARLRAKQASLVREELASAALHERVAKLEQEVATYRADGTADLRMQIALRTKERDEALTEISRLEKSLDTSAADLRDAVGRMTHQRNNALARYSELRDALNDIFNTIATYKFAALTEETRLGKSLNAARALLEKGDK